MEQGCRLCIEPRNLALCGQWITPGRPGGKPTFGDNGRQQSYARYGDVQMTPPGSRTRACSHGGNLGTREIQLSPCKGCGIRRTVPRRDKFPGDGKGCAPASHRVSHRAETQTAVSTARYWGTRAKSEGTREGQLEVLADHSTDGQGRVT